MTDFSFAQNWVSDSDWSVIMNWQWKWKWKWLYHVKCDTFFLGSWVKPHTKQQVWVVMKWRVTFTTNKQLSDELTMLIATPLRTYSILRIRCYYDSGHQKWWRHYIFGLFVVCPCVLAYVNSCASAWVPPFTFISHECRYFKENVRNSSLARTAETMTSLRTSLVQTSK